MCGGVAAGGVVLPIATALALALANSPAADAFESFWRTPIRFGIGRFNTEEEIDYVADLVVGKVSKLRELSPLWEMFQEGIDIKSIEWTAAH